MAWRCVQAGVMKKSNRDLLTQLLMGSMSQKQALSPRSRQQGPASWVPGCHTWAHGAP